MPSSFPAPLRRTLRTVLATGLAVSVVGLAGCAKQSAVPPVAAPIPAAQQTGIAEQTPEVAASQPAPETTADADTTSAPTPAAPTATASTSVRATASTSATAGARTGATATPESGRTTSARPTTTGSSSATAGTRTPEATKSTPTANRSATPAPQTPERTGGVPVLNKGAEGDRVRDLQARLKQLDWFGGDITGYYGSATGSAVSGFQAKRGLPATGAVDQRTLDQLTAMTKTPSAAELAGQPTPTPTPSGTPKSTPSASATQQGQNTQTPPAVPGIDPRCNTGRVLCISKEDNTLRWMVNGQVLTTMDVRFGVDELPTREGSFKVFWKSRDHVSTIYHTPMPYAMFFSGGQAVHYSPDFAARGYNGGSHGCVNVRDQAGIQWLFGQVREGDKVIVYS